MTSQEIMDQLLEKRLYEKLPEAFRRVGREARRQLLKDLPAEERLEGLPAEERLKGLAAEERLKGLAAEERLKGLAAEERLKGLSAQEIETLRNLLK